MMTSTRTLLLCLSFSCVAASSVAQDSIVEEAAPLAFVDAHVHLNRPAMQLQLIDQYKLPKVIAFWGRDSDHESLIEAANAHPDHFIPFVSISFWYAKCSSRFSITGPRPLVGVVNTT